MKRALAITLVIIALLPSLLAYRSPGLEVTAAPLLSHELDTIEPIVTDWPQKEDNWCGAAVLQAYIDYSWRFHHGDGGHFYTQSLSPHESERFFSVGRSSARVPPGFMILLGSKCRLSARKMAI